MQVNRNHYIAKKTADMFARLGLRYVCISPGSRSTPLALAFGSDKRFQSFVIPDERSAAFFALGIAKASGKPAVLICTSGTAAAEYFPAVVEAYQQRVPMILCTADRPPGLQNCGANQTINQHHLYGQYARLFIDMELPSVDHEYIRRIKIKVRDAWNSTLIKDRGPVHLNFPFAKPLEPESYTDKISADEENDEQILSEIDALEISEEEEIDTGQIWDELNRAGNILLLAGPAVDGEELSEEMQRFAVLHKIPVFADGASGLRHGGGKGFENILCNYDVFLRRSDSLPLPDIVIQIGRAHTSPLVEQYIRNVQGKHYLINRYGDYLSPAKKADKVLKLSPKTFFAALNRAAEEKIPARNDDYLRELRSADIKAENVKKELFDSAELNNEGTAVRAIVSLLPDGSNLMLSNSLPVRLYDWFISKENKNIRVFASRGASGIDGITSTALGIAAASEKRTYLIIGDLAFYHDTTALLTAVNYELPLTIILLNNNGGGIFSHLPIAQSAIDFKTFFKTPHNIRFRSIAEGFGCEYYEVHNKAELSNHLHDKSSIKGTKIVEIRTDTDETLRLLTILRQKGVE